MVPTYCWFYHIFCKRNLPLSLRIVTWSNVTQDLHIVLKRRFSPKAWVSVETNSQSVDTVMQNENDQSGQAVPEKETIKDKMTSLAEPGSINSLSKHSAIETTIDSNNMRLGPVKEGAKNAGPLVFQDIETINELKSELPRVQSKRPRVLTSKGAQDKIKSGQRWTSRIESQEHQRMRKNAQRRRLHCKGVLDLVKPLRTVQPTFRRLGENSHFQIVCIVFRFRKVLHPVLDS